MRITALNKKITFMVNEEVDNDFGETEIKQVLYKRVWAEVKPTVGKQYEEAKKNRNELTYKITCRYFEGLKPNMFITYKDRTFDIIDIINVEEKNVELVIMCTEKIKV